MRITGVELTETARGARLDAAIELSDNRREDARLVFRDTGADVVAAPGDALVAMSLIPAMALGEDLEVDAPVSRKLLDAAPRIAGFFVAWLPRLHRTVVTAPSADRSSLGPTEVGATFSGGVDSFYTVLRPHSEPITRLLTTISCGPDSLLADPEPYIAKLSAAANELGIRHTVVESSVVPMWRRYVPAREEHGYLPWGPMMVASALALAGMLRRFHVAASWSLEPVPPWNSHPELDPLWSTESLDVRHDGIVPREEKMLTVAASDIALRTLHVCPRPDSPPVNCGRCAKCVATALMLHNVGAGRRAVTLPAITPTVVRSTYVAEPWRPAFERLLTQTRDAELRNAVAHALRRTAFRRRLHPLGTLLRRAGLPVAGAGAKRA